MKKKILSILIMGSFGLYVIWQANSSPVVALSPQPVVTSKKKARQPLR